LTIRLERATAEDAALFATWEQASDTKEYIIPYSRIEHLNSMSDPDLLYLRIMKDGELTGFFILALDADGRSVEFRRVVIAAKGIGTGQSAISAMERFCVAELHRTRIWLDVFEHNSRGLHLYRKLGYEEFGAVELDGRRLLLYQKTL